MYMYVHTYIHIPIGEYIASAFRRSFPPQRSTIFFFPGPRKISLLAPWIVPYTDGCWGSFAPPFPPARSFLISATDSSELFRVAPGKLEKPDEFILGERERGKRSKTEYIREILQLSMSLSCDSDITRPRTWISIFQGKGYQGRKKLQNLWITKKS